MKYFWALAFGVFVGVAVLTAYSQVSTYLPIVRSACIDGERFTLHRAWQGVTETADGKLRMEWQSWMTPQGERCGGPAPGAVATNPEATG